MTRPIAAHTIAAAMCLVALTACSDDGPPGETLGSGSESSTAPVTPSESVPTASATTGPTSPSPADPGGVTVEVTDVARLVAPKGWKLDKFTDFIVGASEERTLSAVAFNVINPDPTRGAGGIDAWAASAVRNGRGGSLENVKVLDPVVIDGVESYHVVGTLGTIDTVHLYGAYVGGASIQVDFDFTPSYSNKQRQRIMDSVLATVEYLTD